MAPDKPSKAQEQKWQAEDDLRHLSAVQEIKKDRARYRRALKLAKEQMSALKEVENV